MDKKTILLTQLLVLLTAASARAQDSAPGLPDSAYVPGEYRVYTGLFVTSNTARVQISGDGVQDNTIFLGTVMVEP